MLHTSTHTPCPVTIWLNQAAHTKSPPHHGLSRLMAGKNKYSSAAIQCPEALSIQPVIASIVLAKKKCQARW